MDTNAAAYDVEVIESWGYTRDEAISGAARWAFTCVKRNGADTHLLCYLQGLAAIKRSEEAHEPATGCMRARGRPAARATLAGTVGPHGAGAALVSDL